MLKTMIIFPLIVSAIRRLLCNDPEPMPLKPFPSEAEIDAKLATIAKERGLKSLDWKNSIVDLMVVLEIKNDFHARALLYAELGGEGEYKGTAAQNTLMIQQVRQRFAEGKID